MIRDGVNYRFIRDVQGSVRLVVDSATGAIAQRMDYDSFGNVLLDTNPGFQPFGFQSGLYDGDTALVQFGARWYDAVTGRWLSKDPILLEGGFNLYVFCGNDPVNYCDPWGLCEKKSDFAIKKDSILAAAICASTTSLTYAGGPFDPTEVPAEILIWGGAVLGISGYFIIDEVIPAIREYFNKKSGSRDGELPSRGEPNSTGVRDNGYGTGQIRDYGPDGKPIKDYDFGSDHNGDPHVHDWDWGKKKPRGPRRPVGSED